MTPKNVTNWMALLTVGALVGGGILISKAVAKEEADDEQTVSLADTPAAVQTTAQKQLHGAAPAAVIKESDDGFTVYEIEFELNSGKHSIDVAANGAVLEREDELAASTLPEAVIAQLQKQYPNAKIADAQAVTSTYFEVTVDTGRKQREVKLFANGQEVEIGQD